MREGDERELVLINGRTIFQPCEEGKSAVINTAGDYFFRGDMRRNINIHCVLRRVFLRVNRKLIAALSDCRHCCDFHFDRRVNSEF